MNQTTVLKELRLSPKYIKTQGEWEEIIESVNVLYDNYTIRLNQRYQSLTESDIQICILIKLRWKGRMGVDLGENGSLDMYLYDY